MSNLSLPYALHPARGNITPDHEQDGVGRRANVTCLGCGERLEHRRASHDSRRRAHYAHMADTQADLGHCLETAIHARAKDLLASVSGRLVTLPDWYGTATTIVVAHAEVEQAIGNRRVDVLWRNHELQQLVIEVKYSNPKRDDFVRDVRQLGIPALEFIVTQDDAHIQVDQLVNRIRQSKWLIEPTEPFFSEDPPQTDITNHLERWSDFDRRKTIIDRRLGAMMRNRHPAPQFSAWHTGRNGTQMYPKTQRLVFANAIIITEVGFRQHNPEKPWLFRYWICQNQRKQDIYLYADLGGSYTVPIYKNTASILYAFEIVDMGDGRSWSPWSQDRDGETSTVEDAVRSQDIYHYLIAAAGERLQDLGVAVRTGFESPYYLSRREQNPVRHVDPRMLSGLVDDAEAQRRRIQGERRRAEELQEADARHKENEARLERQRQEYEAERCRAEQSADWRQLNEWIKSATDRRGYPG